MGFKFSGKIFPWKNVVYVHKDTARTSPFLLLISVSGVYFNSLNIT